MLRAFAFIAVTTAVVAGIACSNDETPESPPDEVAPSPTTTTTSTTTSTTTGTNNPPPPPPPSNVVTSSVTLDIDGTARRYVLALPKTYDANKAYPLIVGLHGDGQGADGFVSFSKLDAVAGLEAVLAFPDQSVDLFTDFDNNPDQKLVKAVIDDVKGKQNIDAAKVWGFGYSKGAYMLWELQCKQKGFFTALAVHAAGAPSPRNEDGSINCPGAEAVPMFVTQGQNDQGTGSLFGADYFADLAGCASERAGTQPDYCGAYEGCNAATPVIYCEIPNQPHFPLYDKAAADSWAFFKAR